MQIKFSIITVSYNSKKTIEQTIKSVLNQTYIDFEYIIVDGGSTDGTLDIIKKYAEKDNRIKYISEPDNGIYYAMNKGIKMAQGDVISLINSDDYYENDALEKVAKQIPEMDKYVVYGMVRILENEAEKYVVLYNHNELPKNMIMHPGCFVSKSVYSEYEYDTQYRLSADYDLFVRLYRDKSILFVPLYEIVANFRIGGMSNGWKASLEAADIKYKNGYIGYWEKTVYKVYCICRGYMIDFFRKTKL